MADDMTSAGRRRTGLKVLPRPVGAAPVWVLNLVIIALGGLLHATLCHRIGVLDSRLQIPWYLLAMGFGLAEIHVVHLRFRSEAHSFSLNEIPLILGLFFCSANGLVLAQLVGAAFALVLHRRQSPLKLVFNLAAFGLEATL